jgi:hypothetical protein
MECDEVEIRLWEYLDQELGQKEAGSVEAHLDRCNDCWSASCRDRRFLELLARVARACSSPPNLALRVKQVIRH